MPSPPIVIIGAGAAGLMAAAELVAAGRRVLIVERADRAGRKILASGGGRCNFTHDLDAPTMVDAFDRRQGRFLKPAIHEFPPADLRRWMADRGVPSVVEADGCVFPESGRAGDVVSALIEAARASTAAGPGATFQMRSECRRILVDGGRVVAVETPDGRISASAVIVAAGGPAWPAAGGTLAGLDLLREAGHTIVPPRPALAPLYVDAPWVRNLQGISVEHARLTVGKVRVGGPLLFTHFGLSGPAALDASLHIDHTPADVRLAVLPQYTPETLEAQFVEVAAAHGGRRLDLLLSTLVPRRLAQEIVELAGVPVDSTLGQLRKPWRRAAAVAATDLALRVDRLGDWPEAMVSAGGCALDEIAPKTMTSRKVDGLFVVGESLDVAGPTGGYNLHAALATGRLAARAITAE